MDALHALTDGHLRALAASLRSGRLSPPYAAVAVQRACGDSDLSAEAAGCLQQLNDAGMAPAHVAVLAEAILQARCRVPTPADVVDLVWTGPEVGGLANRDTAVVVRDLFGAAEAEVLVAGFAVYRGRGVFGRLAERMVERPTLRVRLFLDVGRSRSDTSLDTEIVRRFARKFVEHDWPRGHPPPEVFYDPRSLRPDTVGRSSLHAKCVVVDRQVAFVTSANFTEAAHTRNIEVGVLVRAPRLAARLADHFGTLANAGTLCRVTLPT
jgi:hypothetical protein